MMRKNPVYTLGCLVLLGTAATACGGNRGPVLPEFNAEQENFAYVSFLERFDTNRDGEITCLDASLKRDSVFETLDKDENGQLDAGEYRFAKFEDRAFQYIELSDVDSDQSLTISKTEFASVPNADYLALDQDRNCVASREEILLAARIEADKRRIQGSGLGLRPGQKKPGRDDGPGIEEIDPINEDDKKKTKKKEPPLAN